MTAHRPSFFVFADESVLDYSSIYGKPGFFVPCSQIKQFANFLKAHHAISIGVVCRAETLQHLRFELVSGCIMLKPKSIHKSIASYMKIDFYSFYDP
jgi:hypothetical protein